MPQFGVYLTIIIYDHKMFIVQATERLARDKRSSLFYLFASAEEKKIYNIFQRPSCSLIQKIWRIAADQDRLLVLVQTTSTDPNVKMTTSS